MAAKHCPLCRLINPATSMRCDCGYVFGQEEEDARDEISAEISSAHAKIAAYSLALMFVVAISLVAFAEGIIVKLGLAAWLVVQLVRSVMRLVGFRRSMRELFHEPPRARVVQRQD
jgi:uncharacterized membrane protein